MKRPADLSEIVFELDNNGIVHLITMDWDELDGNGCPVYKEIDTISKEEYFKIYSCDFSDPQEMKESFIEQIQKMRAYGFSDDDMIKMIKDSNKPEHILIDKHFNVCLKDHNECPIPLGPLEKTLFFFYLLHTEGVSTRYLADHKEELLHIYMQLSGKESIEDMKKSIDNLTNKFSSSFTEKRSHIIAAFRSKVPSTMVYDFAPSGERGKRKFINIDRNLVEWERPLVTK